MDNTILTKPYVSLKKEELYSEYKELYQKYTTLLNSLATEQNDVQDVPNDVVDVLEAENVRLLNDLHAQTKKIDAAKSIINEMNNEFDSALSGKLFKKPFDSINIKVLRNKFINRLSASLEG